MSNHSKESTKVVVNIENVFLQSNLNIQDMEVAYNVKTSSMLYITRK